MDLLNKTLLISFFTSIFSSIMFYIMLWMLKPRVKISGKIARTKVFLDGVQKTIYTIKVINKTWWYKVLDVRCELLLLKTYNTDGGVNVRSKPIELARDQIWFIRRRYFNNGNIHAPYASIFGTFENLDEKWDDVNKRLQFRLMCKHSLSGFSRVFDVTYYQRNSSITNGQFKFGDSIEIV